MSSKDKKRTQSSVYQLPAKVLSAPPQDREPPAKMMKHDRSADNLNSEGTFNLGYLSQTQSYQSMDYFGELEDNSFVDLLGQEENSVDIITTVYRDDDDGALNIQHRNQVTTLTDRGSLQNGSQDKLASMTGNHSVSLQINEQNRSKQLDSSIGQSSEQETILRSHQRELDRQQRQSLQKAVNFEMFRTLSDSDGD